MIDLEDLRNLNICEKCGVVFMPTTEQNESHMVVKYCKNCQVVI